MVFATNLSAFFMSGIEITIQRYASSRARIEEKEIKQYRKRKDDDSWLNVVPSERLKPKKCDELSDEFKRAGIGQCFEGRQKLFIFIIS